MLSEVRCAELIGDNMTDVEEINKKLVSAVIQTAEETAGGKCKKSVPRWDDS